MTLLPLRSQQVRQLKAERIGDPAEMQEAYVALPALDFAHVGSVDPSGISEGLLGHFARMAHRAKRSAKLA